MALQSNGQEHHGSGPQARASDLGLLLGVVLPPLLAGGSDRAPPSAGSQAQEGRGSYSQQLHIQELKIIFAAVGSWLWTRGW